MARQAASGTAGLIKRHRAGCPNRRDLTRCECPWRGKYKGEEVTLAAWAQQAVNPREKAHAKAVLGRMKAAIDAKTFTREREQPALGDKQRLSDFLIEWQTHHVAERNLSQNSLPSMVGVISAGLGRWSLDHLAGHPLEIERWLNSQARARRWSNGTWNRYRELLHSIFARAMKWDRIIRNPVAKIDPRVEAERPGVRLEEDLEDRLFAACERLNRPQQRPNRSRLTYDIAETIRARVAAGEAQAVLAREYQTSATTICQIVSGRVWNPDHVRTGTKGTEMRRRLVGAFDGGLRAGEMCAVQLKHVEKKPLLLEIEGVQHEVYRIALPPEVTKGGKTTGEIEYVYAATARFKQVLQERRFALKGNPEGYVFGTEAGKQVRGFKRLWHELFRLAGLDYGRHKGLVWHTVRHEFISRHAENTGDPVLTKELARHRDLETTQGYFHTRKSRVLQAAVGLERGRVVKLM